MLLGIGDGTFAAAQEVIADPQAEFRYQQVGLSLADMNNDQNIDIVTGDYNDKISIIPGNGDGTFDTPWVLDMDGFHFLNSPLGLVTADEDGDGNLDVFYASVYTDDIRILRGNGDGTLRPDRLQRIGVGRQNRDVLAEDLDNDGDQDIVVFSGDADEDLSIALNQGDGTFDSATLYALNGVGSSSETSVGVRAADVGLLNGDEFPDLVFSIAYRDEITEFETRIMVLPGNGDGTFSEPIYSGTNVMGEADAIVLADMNGDGLLDVSGSGWNGSSNGDNNMVVMLGNGDGTFVPSHSSIINNSSREIRAADLDLDGKLDLVLAKWNGDVRGIVTYPGNGDGTLGEFSVHYGRSLNIGVADFNLDLLPDIVSVDAFEGRVFLGQPGGGFAEAPQLLEVEFTAESVEAADVTGDSVPDILVMDTFDNQVMLYVGNGDGTFRRPPILFGAGPTPGDPAIADFNNDGRPDLAVRSECCSDDVQILIQK